MPKSLRLMKNSLSRVADSGVTPSLTGNWIDLVTPWSMRLPVTVCVASLALASVLPGLIAVDSKVDLGCLATSKKSGDLRCPVRRSASVKSESMAISAWIRLSSGFPGTRAQVPWNDLKPPLWLPVTLDPVNSIFDVSGPNLSRSAPLGNSLAATPVPIGAEGEGAAVVEVPPGAGLSTLGADTFAGATSSAGLLQPEVPRQASTVNRERAAVE